MMASRVSVLEAVEAEAVVEHVKDPAAVELGRRGGLKRVANQTPKERSESARRASMARWASEDHFSDDKAREFLRLPLPMSR